MTSRAPAPSWARVRTTSRSTRSAPESVPLQGHRQRDQDRDRQPCGASVLPGLADAAAGDSPRPDTARRIAHVRPPATGERSLTGWIAAHGAELGRTYANELDRHYRQLTPVLGNHFNKAGLRVRPVRAVAGTPERGRGPDPAAKRRVLLARLLPSVSRSETRSHRVSWGFAAGSVAWLAPSRGGAVAALPVGEVSVRPTGGAGPL